MPSNFTLGGHFEDFTKRQMASGRDNNASEVMCDALQLLEEREQRLEALDAALMRGPTDIEAGRVIPAETVFDELESKYMGMAQK